MIGRMPTLTSGFGIVSECSRKRVPRPPQNSTTFMMRGAHGAGCQSSRAPEEVFVELTGALQILQLLQARESSELVGVGRKIDALEQLPQLLGAPPGCPA